MTATRAARAGLIALVSGLLVGCGDDGGDGDSGARSSTLTKQQVIERGDEICRDARENVEPLAERLRASPQPRYVGKVLHQVAREAKKMARGLDALRAPRSGRKAIDRYVKGVREQIVVVERAADSLEAGRLAEARTLLGSDILNDAKLERLLRRYGFTVCGHDRALRRPATQRR